MEDTLIILNPAAKGEKALRFLKKIESLQGVARIELTKRVGDAEILARVAVESGVRKIVAAGGDGTVNGVVNGIGQSGATLGVLPVGTMNVLASELGLPRDIEGCWDVICKGNLRQIDLACANERYFIQLAGVGLDAQVVRETDLGFRKKFGPLSYVVSMAQIAARKPPKLVVKTPDGRTRAGSFVLIGNGRFYGGPFKVFRDAAMDDGLLDVIVFRDLGYLDIARYVQSVIFGGLTDLESVDYFQTTSLHVTSEEVVPVELDGEVDFDVPVLFSLAPAKLAVCVPLKPTIGLQAT